MSLKAHCTGIQHVGIPTNNLEATVAFFKKLGFAVALRTGSEKKPVAFLSLKNVMIETYQIRQAIGAPGAIDHLALNVDDIQATYADVTALGFSALEEGVQFLPLWERGVRFFTILGPDGEKIEFSQKL